MAGLDQLADDGSADKAGRAGEEYTHYQVLQGLPGDGYRLNFHSIKVVTLSWYNIQQDRMSTESDNLLGAYLRDRRVRLDPAAFGFAVGRRRTPGLRREEVAQRANISPT